MRILHATITASVILCVSCQRGQSPHHGDNTSSNVSSTVNVQSIAQRAKKLAKIARPTEPDVDIEKNITVKRDEYGRYIAIVCYSFRPGDGICFSFYSNGFLYEVVLNDM